MSDHKIAFIWGADGNFGMFDRDIEIAKALADAKRKTGYPERMRMNYSKTNFKVVFEIIKIFKDLILKAYGEKSPDGKRFIEWRTNKKLNWFQRKMIKVFFGLDYERAE